MRPSFVWFEGGANGVVSQDLFRFEEARHDLPRMVLDHFSAQGGRGLNLSLSNEDWTRIVESYCKRRLFLVWREFNSWSSVTGGHITVFPRFLFFKKSGSRMT